MACIPVKVARSLKLALQKGDLNVDDLLLKSQDERDAILLKYMDEKQAKSVKEFLIKRYNPELSDELVEEIFTRTEKIKQLRGAEKPVTLEEFTKMEQPPKWALEYVNLNNKIEDVLNPTNNMGLRDTLKFQAKEGIEKIKSQPTLGGKVLEVGKTAADLLTSPVFKSIKASMDMSYALRQGFKILTKSPGRWKESFEQAWKVWKNVNSKEKMTAVMNDFKARYLAHPHYEMLVNDGKLAFGAVEDFFPSTLSQKIPAVGNIFKGSDEAFTIFSQSARFGLASDMIEKQLKIKAAQGIQGLSKQEVKDIATLANSITGRGGLGKLEAASGILNRLFFSARFIRSQADTFLMPFNPAVTPFVRAEAQKHTAATLASIAGLIAVASLFGDVETDPRSSAFGKVKLSNNTSVDLTAGLGSLIVLATKIGTGESKSARTGKITDLRGDQYGAPTVTDTLKDWAKNKLAPAPGQIANILDGKDFSGEKPTLQNTITGTAVPISIENIIELMQTEEGAVIVAAWVADALGMSTQTIPK